MLGCLTALAKTTASQASCDLERLKMKAMSAEADLGFDASKFSTADEIAQLKRVRLELSADISFKGTPVKVVACGAPDDLHVSESDLAVRAAVSKPKMVAVQPD
jgi:anaerobic magnesium-protoporphyrin IX monomethyl ester cyclase